MGKPKRAKKTGVAAPINPCSGGVVQYGLDTNALLVNGDGSVNTAQKISSQNMTQARWLDMIKPGRPIRDQVATRYGTSTIPATFVGRYLKFSVPGRGGGGLSRKESAAILANNIAIVSLFEGSNSPGHFTKDNGIADVDLAVRRGILLKQPLGSAIYFAVDFDCTSSDRILEYFSAIHYRMEGELGKVYAVGAYGSHFVLDLLYEEGFIDHCWQAGAYGWTGNEKLYPSADIVQYDPGDKGWIKIDGKPFDPNTAGFQCSTGFGQWSKELAYDTLSSDERSKLDSAWRAAGGQGTAKDPIDDFADY